MMFKIYNPSAHVHDNIRFFNGKAIYASKVVKVTRLVRRFENTPDVRRSGRYSEVPLSRVGALQQPCRTERP